MSGYLVDTSIFIAAERGEPPVAPPPGRARISVMTLTELLLGALSAEAEAKAGRAATLARAQSFVSIPYDEAVADAVAKLIHACRRARRRASLPDAIIAGTALVHDLTVWTRDHDFTVLAEAEPTLRVQAA